MEELLTADSSQISNTLGYFITRYDVCVAGLLAKVLTTGGYVPTLLSNIGNQYAGHFVVCFSNIIFLIK